MSKKKERVSPVVETTLNSTTERDQPAWHGTLRMLLVLIVACFFATMLYIDIARELKALMALGLMFSLMLLGVSIGISMGIAGAAGLALMLGIRPTMATLVQVPFGSTASSTFVVLPMFVFMGLMLWHSGISTKLYAAAKILFSWLPGGLAATTNIAGAGLGAVSGSTVAITYALGRIGIAEMLRNGYDRRLAIGSVLSAGTIGQLIPPSILLIIYAGFAEVPAGPQLIAGAIPGIVLAVAYVLTVVAVAIIAPSWVGKGGKNQAERIEGTITFKKKLKIVAAAWPVPALILILFGGLGGGFLTVTEASSVGTVLSVVYCFAMQGPKKFLQSFGETVRGTLAAVGSVLLLIIGAAILSRLLAVTGAAQWLSMLLKEFSSDKVQFFAALVLFYFVLGMFMDSIAMMLLTTPLLLPIITSIGYPPIWFGVFLVLMAEIGVLTPPVGLLTFIGHRIAQNPEINLGQKVSLHDVFAGAMLFVPFAVAVAVLLIIFPNLVLWLPGQMIN